MDRPMIRILFVEDEMLLRMAVVPGLEEAGYLVDQAATGQQALAFLREHGDAIGLAIIDIGLPDMKGDRLATELWTVLPALPVVLATGYGEADLRAAFGRDSRVEILGKPYFLEDLLGTIRQIAGAGLPAAGDTLRIPSVPAVPASPVIMDPSPGGLARQPKRS
jgi:CheY-like chemotaxis protein